MADTTDSDANNKKKPEKDRGLWFCSHDDCEYNSKSGRPFKTKTHLRQHEESKHMEKIYDCSKCSKKFEREWERKNHEAICGRTWSCSTCDNKYTEIRSLEMHCKRQGHKCEEILRRPKKQKQSIQNTVIVYVPVILQQNVTPINLFNAKIETPKDRTLLPKTTSSMTPCETKSIEAEIQTENITSCSCTSQTVHNKFSSISKELFTKQQTSTQTDSKVTSSSKTSAAAQCPPMRRKTIRKRKSVQDIEVESIETQTNESTLSVPAPKIIARDAKTATTLITHPRKKPKKSVTVETATEIVRPVSPVISRRNPLLSEVSSFATQVNLDCSVQTDAFIEPSNKETQTATELSGSVINHDDDLFFEFQLNDNETQTTWNAEVTTQTEDMNNIDVDQMMRELFSGSTTGLSDNVAGTAEMETQTQVDWKHLNNDFV